MTTVSVGDRSIGQTEGIGNLGECVKRRAGYDDGRDMTGFTETWYLASDTTGIQQETQTAICSNQFAGIVPKRTWARTGDTPPSNARVVYELR
jgi:hypothetical protein